MIAFVKENKKTSIFGILAIFSEVIRNNPSIIGFLPDVVEGYVFGASSLIFAVLTVISARDAKSPAQAELERVQKEQEKQDLKAEIKQETASLVEAKVPEAVAAVTAVPEALVVKEIKTDTITVSDKEKTE